MVTGNMLQVQHQLMFATTLTHPHLTRLGPIVKKLCDIENKLMVTKSERESGRDKLGVWD